MNSNYRRPSLLGPISALALVGLLVPMLAMPASAAPSPQPGQAPMQWAYGTEHWFNVSTVLPHGTYTANAFFGWNVIYTLTNTSNSSFEVEAQRTMGISYTSQYCSPSCGQATAMLSLRLTGSERETGFVNFTVNGSVDEMGTAAQAIGLLNSHSVAQGHLNETVSGSRVLAGRSETGSATFDVAAHAEAQVGFTGSLGLVPWNTVPGDSWNSSAPFAASGSWGVDYSWSTGGSLRNASASANGSGSPSGSVNGSGTASVAGQDLGNLTLANGLNTSVIIVTWTGGPFDGVDGVILVPHAFEIFGVGSRAFAGHAPGLQSVLTSRVDMFVDRLHHHVRFAAAAANYQGSDSLATASSGSVTVSADNAAVGPTASNVQAQPESVPAAQSQACSFAGCGGSRSAPGGTDLRPLAVLAGAVVVVAVLGSAGVYQYRLRNRRRSMSGVAVGSASQFPPPPTAGGLTPANYGPDTPAMEPQQPPRP
jgi:hypothetical protein